MEKHKVVVFTENNARVLVNPPDLDAWRKRKDALVDPDFGRVAHLAPHFWKCDESGHLSPMTEEERNARISHHAENEVMNRHVIHDHRPAVLRHKSQIHEWMYVYSHLTTWALLVLFLLALGLFALLGYTVFRH